MTDPVATAERGWTHEATLYGSTDEYTEVVAAFIQSGIEADEPTLVAVPQRNTGLLRSAVDDSELVSFLDGVADYQQPTSAIRTLGGLYASYLERGAARVRVVSEVGRPVAGRPWEWWARCEAALNIAFAGQPLGLLCPYDSKTTPTGVLSDVLRTHPCVTAPGGSSRNPEYDYPRDFLLHRPAGVGADSLEAQPPAVEQADPSSASARAAVRRAGAATALDRDEVDEYAAAVSEAVSNAGRHGRPPVRMRLWSAPDRLVTTVTDEGPGPQDPLVGLFPPVARSSDGIGLWLAHQMCSHITLGTDEAGFTIRLVAGQPNREMLAV